MGSEDARLPHKAGISLLLAQTFSFETPQGSVQGLFLFLPLLSLLVNFTPFRGFKLHLYADVPTFASQTQSPPLLQEPDLVLPIAFCLEHLAGA